MKMTEGAINQFLRVRAVLHTVMLIRDQYISQLHVTRVAINTSRGTIQDCYCVRSQTLVAEVRDQNDLNLCVVCWLLYFLSFFTD